MSGNQYRDRIAEYVHDNSRNAVFCDPPEGGERDVAQTIELDHVLASVFGLWSVVLPESRRFVAESQLSLPHAGFGRVSAPAQTVSRKPGKAG